MEIRRSVPADAPAIAAAEELIFSDPWSERAITDLISTEGAMCYTAKDGDKVIHMKAQAFQNDQVTGI